MVRSRNTSNRPLKKGRSHELMGLGMNQGMHSSSGRKRPVTDIGWVKVKGVLISIENPNPDFRSLRKAYIKHELVSGQLFVTARTAVSAQQAKMPETAQEIYEALNLSARDALLIEMDRLAFAGKNANLIEKIARDNLRAWGYQV